MKSSLDISLETLTLAVSLSALRSAAVSVVASGGLADKFGRMRMTTLGLGLSIVGSAMLVVAPGPRAVPGRPGAAGAVGGVHYAGDAGAIKTWYEGVRGSGGQLLGRSARRGGSGLCSFVGGAIATGLGWRWIFVFSIAVALLALFLLRGTPESRSTSASQHKLDVGGLLRPDCRAGAG
ncbi:MFS transporter [Klebsiella variicola subsp. variicola]|nr:MFS transporter [Klebsiella variicola subsp. variicola]